MRVLIIDNYDSFTFNLYQYVGEILTRQHLAAAVDIVVKRNDEITLQGVFELNADRIIVSPGPGSPADEAYFGVCRQVLLEAGKTIPTLGVCLGMQGIAHCFGGKVVRATLPMHGKTSAIVHDEQGVFVHIPQNLEVMRYHSLMVDAETLPECLTVSSVVSSAVPANDATDDLLARARSGDEIMGLRHRQYPIEGIQFHPESFATEGAQQMLSNFLLQP